MMMMITAVGQDCIYPTGNDPVGGALQEFPTPKHLS